MAKGKYEYWLTEEGLLKLESWARDGLTDKQISHNIGIAYSTFRDWKTKYPALSAPLKRGKEVIDILVENALLKRALGYNYTEITKEVDEDTGELIVTKTVTKQVAADTTSQIFWLKNRRPDKWREKQNIECSGSVDINNPFAELTTEQLKKLAGGDDG